MPSPSALLLSLLPVLALAQGPGEDPTDCGLEPPGAVYVPAPGPRSHEAQRWTPAEPPLVRREVRVGTRSAMSGLPQTRVRSGALSGKVIYLSPGHGFYRSAPLGRWATQRPNTNDVVEDFISAEVLNQYLLPLLMNAGATVVPVREPDLNPRMVIVNNGDADYQEVGPAELFSTSELPGWGPPPLPMANNVEPFGLGGSRRMQAASTATASVTWAPSVPADGDYHVYVGYEASPARVPDAHYVVKHAGGESHFRVNQRRHGGTWVLLGRFHFKAGQHPETASVVALNDSTASGTVSLDAVRWGGGSGAIGDATLGPLPRPRYEEAARYHMQFSGAPVSVYAPSGANALSNERTDDVTSRARFARWHHEDGEDAVYVAWHTNALAGRTVGTEGYVYGPNAVDGTLNFTGVAGSDVLGRALLAELGQDLRAAVDPQWTVRNLRSANFGELNPAHNPETPAVLLEIAYHDSPVDAARLKEPDFRYVAARALLQGLIKYFATRDGQVVRLPPEPPAAVVARNGADGRVEVRWAPVAKDAVDLGGHEATAYRVYQSSDGMAWDEGAEVTGTTFTVPLPAGTTRYFRVAAVNAGGESFPSDLVGVRTGATPAVLLLNAFDRLDSTLARAEALTAYELGAPLRVLLEAMNDGSYVRRHGEALARHEVAFDSATNEALATAGFISLANYRMLDWFTGRGGAGGKGPTRAEQDALRAFVTGGGHLLLSGSHLASTLAGGDAADQAFLADILRASPGNGTPSPLVQGQPGDYLAALAGVALDDGTRGAYPAGLTDVLLPSTGATSVLRYADSGLSAGVASRPGGEVLLLGVPFEGLTSPARRGQLMGAFLARGGVLAAPPPPPAEEPPPVDPGAPNRWQASTGADPRPLPPPPPPPPPPTPVVRERMPEFYPRAETGCGCGAGMGTASLPWLLVLGIVQLQRARRHRPDSKR